MFSLHQDEPGPESPEEEVASVWTSGHLCDFEGWPEFANRGPLISLERL